MRVTAEAWEEVVTIINYEFIRTRTPLTPKLMHQILEECVALFEEVEQ